MKIQYNPIQLQIPQYVHTCAVSSDGKYLVLGQGMYAGDKSNLTIWDMQSLQFIAEIKKQAENTILKARYVGNQLVYLDDLHHIYSYDFKDQKLETLNIADLNLDWLSNSGNATRFVAAGALTYVWDMHKQKVIWTSPEEAVSVVYKDVSALGALNPEGTQVALAGMEENQIVIYSVEENSVVQKLKNGPKQAARWISYDPTGSYLATINYGNEAVLLWNMKDGSQYLFEDEEDFEGTWSLAFHPSGNYLACGSLSGIVQILNLNTNETIFSKRIHNKRVWDIAFTPNGKNMISAGEGGAYLWELDGL